ncbi:hypothetical protein [Mycobacterium sp. M23085]|uniref:hypothetical protein n=1 Tax=Mycobacterium sp. M23085 TaxID=3378087 RepID=UPI003878201C
MNSSGLFDALGSIPELTGARCRGQSQVFDETDDPDLVEYAQSLCQTCPALLACTSWLASLPPRKWPSGVVAGQVRTARRGRPKAVSA